MLTGEVGGGERGRKKEGSMAGTPGEPTDALIGASGVVGGVTERSVGVKILEKYKLNHT
jgi:hypothetical protein